MAFGLLIALSFPHVDLWPLGFFSIVPLLWSGTRERGRGFVAAAAVWFGVLPLWLFEQRWIIDVTGPGYPLLATYLAIYPAAFVWLLVRVRRAFERAGGGRTDAALCMAVVAPVLWTGLEVLRGEVLFTGYPWFLLGHPMIHSPALAAPAAIVGAYGVSFLTAALGGAIADAAGWSGVRRGRGGLAAGLIAFVWAGLAWAAIRHDADRTLTLRVAVVQTNVPQDNKIGWTLEQQLADWMRFTELTRRAGATRPRPDLIIWPETMVPGPWLNADAEEVERREGLFLVLGPPASARGGEGASGRRIDTWHFADAMRALQTEVDVPMLVGAPAMDGLRIVRRSDGAIERDWAGRFNSAFLVDGGQVLPGRYDKIELTPFGEVLPYVWRWPELQELIMAVGAGGMTFDVTAGREPHVFEVHAGGPTSPQAPQPRLVGLVVPICFEATKSDLCRRLVRGLDGAHGRAAARPALLVNLSNDGWFGLWEGGRQQHLLAARWRCVELRLPMIRAVNTGISCWIDASGRIVKQGPDGAEADAWVDGVMSAEVPVAHQPGLTPFARVGNILGWTTLGLMLPATLLARLAGAIRAGRGGGSDRSPA
jgi:apolipoprotein N-acyltransferase